MKRSHFPGMLAVLCIGLVGAGLLTFLLLVIFSLREKQTARVSGEKRLAGARPSTAEDWPTYLHDSRRSGITTEQLIPPLCEQWVYMPRHAPQPAWPEPVQPPSRVRFDNAYHVVASGDSVYFASSADNKVYSLDAATGGERWSAYTGGPIRVAPSIWRGNIYVGSDDGQARCLDAADGSVIWKFSGAPAGDRILGNGKMISLWPIRTGVLVDEGIAYFCAGLFPAEGIYIYAVGADDGRLIWRNDTSGQMYMAQPHPGAEGFTGVSPQGPLLASESVLYVPTGRSVPAGFDKQDGRFLFWHHPAATKFGGAWALLSDDLLFNSPGNLVAYTQGTGDKFAVFGGQRIIVTPDTSYVLSADGVTAVDRVSYFEQKRKATQLYDNLLSLRYREIRLGRQLAPLNAEQEAAKKAGGPLDKSVEEEIRELREKLDAVVAEKQRIVSERAKIAEDIESHVKWRCGCESPFSLILAGNVLYVGGQGEVTAIDAEEGRRLWLGRVTGQAHGLAVAGGRLFVSTDEGTIHCFGREYTVTAKARPDMIENPYPADELTPVYRAAAESIVNNTGITEGYCLILGCETGRLAFELAKRTKLRIYGLEPDVEKAKIARDSLDAAGLYGARVSVAAGPAERLPYSSYFANLIVSENALFTGEPVGSAKEMLRVLKPCGGVAYVGAAATKATGAGEKARRWFLDGGITGFETIQDNGVWIRFRRGPLNGGADWTHQYADAANTICSQDALVECPLGLLWFGEPGPANIITRHNKPPAPVSTNGRLFISGNNVAMAHDAYNGVPLWDRELPGCRRLANNVECSNVAASEDSVYIAVAEHCVRLDSQTGETLAKWQVPSAPDGQPRNWGYLAWTADMLLGSATPKFTPCNVVEDPATALRKAGVPSIVTGKVKDSAIVGHPCVTRAELEELLSEFLGEDVFSAHRTALLFDPGVPTGGVSSDSIFALHRKTGELRWVHRIPNGYVRHIAIAVGDGSIFLLETEAGTGKMFLVALDLGTGRERWRSDADVTGCGKTLFTCLAYKDGRVIVGSAFGGRALMAVAASDGKVLWTREVSYARRPVIAGKVIYAEPYAFDLGTGKDMMRVHPITGEKVQWQFQRAYGCGALSAARTCLFFRSGSIGYYDLKNDIGTSGFGGIRPGCWINSIFAGGLVLIPEGSSGCTCSYPIKSTVVLHPTRKQKAWSVFASPGATTPVRHLAINLGAPGDRRDKDGTLWLSYPRPCERFGVKLDMEDEILPQLGYFRHDSELLGVKQTDRPWIFASGCCGLKRCTVRLNADDEEPRTYTVRLAFAEISNTQPGQRVFDVKLQGEVLLEDFDILQSAGGPRTAIVKEFARVRAKDVLTIDLIPKQEKCTVNTAPILNGIEIVAEGEKTRNLQ